MKKKKEIKIICCPFCHIFNYEEEINIKKLGKKEYHCLKCNLKFFTNQIVKSKLYRSVNDYNDCTPMTDEFYLRPERELNFNHNRRKK